jgi:hypothetical protein
MTFIGSYPVVCVPRWIGLRRKSVSDGNVAGKSRVETVGPVPPPRSVACAAGDELSAPAAASQHRGTM